MKKIFTTIILSMIMLLTTISSFVFAENNAISVYLDGKQIQFDVSPQIINERTMVPLRAIFEALGANVNWDADTRIVVASKDDISIVLAIDSDVMFVNENSVVLDSPACIVDGRTLVPARAISEAFNAKVDWDSSKQTVNITYKQNSSENANIELNKVPQNFTDGYERAVFSKFNSYASENGLGDTKIYIGGMIEKIEVTETDNTLGNLIGAVFIDDDHNKWIIAMNFTNLVSANEYDNLINKHIVLCGIYSGYSDKYMMPSVHLVELCVTNSGEIKSGFGKLTELVANYSSVNSDTTNTPNIPKPSNPSEAKVSLRNSKDVKEYLEGKYSGFSFTSSKTDGYDTITETDKVKIKHALVTWDSPDEIEITFSCESDLRLNLSPYSLYPEKAEPCYNAAKKYMKEIADDLMDKLPNTEIVSAEFWYSWYTYPNLKMDLNSVSYCRWRTVNGSFEWWPTSDDAEIQDRI